MRRTTKSTSLTYSVSGRPVLRLRNGRCTARSVISTLPRRAYARRSQRRGRPVTCGPRRVAGQGSVDERSSQVDPESATLYLVVANVGLLVASLITAFAAHRSAKMATQEFRLARMPIPTVEWKGVRPTSELDLQFGGYIHTATDAPMFLGRVQISTAMVHEGGRCDAFDEVVGIAPKTIVTKKEPFWIRALIKGAGAREDALTTVAVGVIKVVVAVGPAAMPTMAEPSTIISIVRRNGQVMNQRTERAEHANWSVRRLAKPWIDGWRGTHSREAAELSRETLRDAQALYDQVLSPIPSAAASQASQASRDDQAAPGTGCRAPRLS